MQTFVRHAIMGIFWKKEKKEICKLSLKNKIPQKRWYQDRGWAKSLAEHNKYNAFPSEILLK